MDDVKLAMLGSKEATRRLTDAGVLVPCWRCNGQAKMERMHTGRKPLFAVSCENHYCGAYGCAHFSEREAIEYWNTRAPILSKIEMEMLEGME